MVSFGYNKEQLILQVVQFTTFHHKMKFATLLLHHLVFFLVAPQEFDIYQSAEGTQHTVKPLPVSGQGRVGTLIVLTNSSCTCRHQLFHCNSAIVVDHWKTAFGTLHKWEVLPKSQKILQSISLYGFQGTVFRIVPYTAAVVYYRHGTSCIRDSKLAKRLQKVCASLPIPPQLESISGVKMRCLVSSINWPCCLPFILMLLVCGGQASGAVAGSIRVKNPHIKIGILASVQKTCCAYVNQIGILESVPKSCYAYVNFFPIVGIS